MLIGSYNPLFVVLSLLVAVLASFTALVMASRVTTAEPGRAANLWLLAGGCAMGFGVWSMHFIGMLAFRLPIPLGYDAWITLQSLLVAVAASIFALWLVSRATLPHLRLALGAVLMGMGIAWMHYLGMDALRMQPGIQYHRGWFALSIIIAVVASWSALFIAFRLRGRENRTSTWLAAAVVMGTAIVGMHYTGMAAANFPENSLCGAARNGGLPSEWLATFVVTLTVAILAIVLLISWLDQRMQSRLLVLRNSLLSASLDSARSELLQAALVDPLTQLPNRQALQEAIEQAITAAGSDPGQPRFAVMFMDLDGFRQVNDAYGHQTGDTLLVLVAQHLRQMLKPGDKAARLGGDQFVMLVTMDNEAEIVALSDRIIHAVSGIRVNGRNLRVTASIGIAQFPLHADNERRLMACADLAMYHAKNTGRNSYALFADWMDQNAEQQLHLLSDLRNAIGTPQIFLHYQPKLRAGTGQVCGAEALIRWRHPVQGLIPAERIVSLAESSGLIAQIGQWALNEACRQLRCWHDAGQRDWNISVNLSPLQLPSPQLLDDVRQTLEQHEISPAHLVLEVTESSVMRDTDASLVLLRELAALGVGISIDDFGTGYSSLLYLKRLPATELKIDHAFIQSLEDSDEDVVIVSAIIALAHALNLDVIAEGVETQGQRSVIERLGCDYLQGFLLGRPVNAENFIRLHGHHGRCAGGEPSQGRTPESAGQH